MSEIGNNCITLQNKVNLKSLIYIILPQTAEDLTIFETGLIQYVIMKKIFTILLMALATGSLASARELQPGYIDSGTTGPAFRMSEWKSHPDDNFYISRVAPKPRFTDKTTQINTDMVPWWTWQKGTSVPAEKFSRKLLMWTPLSFLTAEQPYGALPSGEFNNEVFTMWPYISHYGLWNVSFMHLPGNVADVAHKNGVAVSTHFSSSWADEMNDWGPAIADMRANLPKLENYLNKYRFDGIGYNSEWRNVNYTNDFLAVNKTISALNEQRYANIKDPVTGKNTFSAENIWYDGVQKNQGPRFDNGLISSTQDFFGTAAEKRTSFFFNYNWNGNYSPGSTTKGQEYLEKSVNNAVSMNRSPFDLYAGFNLQGKEPQLSVTGKNTSENLRWTYMRRFPVSIGLWSGHNTNTFWEARNARGSKDYQSQDTYQKTMERWFTNSRNGISNPVYAVDNSFPIDESLVNDVEQDFFGMSKFVEAQSTLCWDLSKEPFISYFNVGNGQYFNWKGITQHEREWYNIGIQDYMPTWRWWWSADKLGRSVNRITTGLKAEFAWNDAWLGGSSLRIKGTDNDANPDYLHLFKTRFALKKGDVITVRYKVYQGGADLSLVLGYGSDSKGTNCKIWDEDEASDDDAFKIMTKGRVPLATWNEKKIIVPETVNDNLAVIALRFDNAEKLNMNIGEISIKRGEYPAPAVPQIIDSKMLGFNMNGVDGKIIYTMDPTEARPYNIDHTVSMFKIYARITYSDGTTTTTLMGATTSWAGIFFEAPYNASKLEESGTVYIGVSAVGIDGVTESEIAWKEAGQLSYNNQVSDVDYAISDDVEISDDFLTDGEVFTVKYADPRHPAADNWELVGPVQNTNVNNPAPVTVGFGSGPGFASVASVKSKTIDKQHLPAGFYDLVVTEGTVKRKFNAFVQVYDPAVSFPEITKFVALDTDGPSPLISAVSAETAKSIVFSEFPNSTFLWADERIQPTLAESHTALPGAGVKVYQNDGDLASGTTPLKLYYEASSKSAGEASNAVRLEDHAIGVVAQDLGMTASKQSFTVAFWVRIKSINAKSWLLNIRDPEHDIWPQRGKGLMWATMNQDGRLSQVSFRIGDGDTEKDRYDINYENPKLEKNAWYHIAYVIDRSSSGWRRSDKFTMYINGRVIGQTTQIQNWHNFKGTYTLGIGGIAAKGEFAGFDGIIDNFQVYNTALSEADVRTSMTENGFVNHPNLVGFWDFEKNENGKVYDETVNHEGYYNKVAKYKNARLIQHYYPTDPADDELQVKVPVPYVDYVGYPAFTGGARNVAVSPEYDIIGCRSYDILPTGTSDNSDEIAGTPYIRQEEIQPVTPFSVARQTADENGLCGYAEFTFPDPGPNSIKVYTCKLMLDNGLGTAESLYRYIYVTRQKAEIVTSVEDAVSEAGTVRVFPNPVTDNMYVAVDENGEYRVRMTDLSGRTVLETVQHADAGECISVNADIPAGTYLVQVIKDGVPAAMQKIIKK